MAFSDQSIALGGFRVGAMYSRDDIAQVGGVQRPNSSRDPHWAVGIVSFANAIVLLVTLDKSNRKDHAYEDRFEDSLFWWQSQNRNSQRSPVMGRILSGSTPVHLFARVTENRRGKACPFVYCGRLTHPVAEAEYPVTVLFENPEYAEVSSEELEEIYTWRPTKTPDERELERESRARSRSPARRRGQGRLQDPRTRRAVEKHAMTLARNHYEAAGYRLVDTSLTRPYDFLALRGEEQLRVEVKGTQGDGSSVILTANEVAAARDGPEATDLFVVAMIEISNQSGELIAAGGTKRILSNWKADPRALIPTEYRYTVPEDRR